MTVTDGDIKNFKIIFGDRSMTAKKKKVNDHVIRNANAAKKKRKEEQPTVKEKGFRSPHLAAFAAVGETNRVVHTAADGTKTPIPDFGSKKRKEVRYTNPVHLIDALLVGDRGTVEACRQTKACAGKPKSFGPQISTKPVACIDCHKEGHEHRWCDTCGDRAVWEDADGKSWCVLCAITQSVDVSGASQVEGAKMCRVCKTSVAHYGTEKMIACGKCARVFGLLLGIELTRLVSGSDQSCHVEDDGGKKCGVGYSFTSDRGGRKYWCAEHKKQQQAEEIKNNVSAAKRTVFRNICPCHQDPTCDGQAKYGDPTDRRRIACKKPEHRGNLVNVNDKRCEPCADMYGFAMATRAHTTVTADDGRKIPACAGCADPDTLDHAVPKQKEILMRAVLGLEELAGVVSVQYSLKPIEKRNLEADVWIVMRRAGKLVAFWIEINENDNKSGAPHGSYDVAKERAKARLFLDPAAHGVTVVHGIHVGVDAMYPVVRDPVTRREAKEWSKEGEASKLPALATAWAAGTETRLEGRWRRDNALTIRDIVHAQIEELLPRDEGVMAFVAYDRTVARHDRHWPTTPLEDADVVVRFAGSCWSTDSRARHAREI